MGLFTPSFNKPGKGVDLNAPQKRSFFRFFEIFFRKFTHFSRVNMIYALTLIPTFIIVFVLVGLASNGILGSPYVSELINSISQQTAEASGDPNLAAQQAAQVTVAIDILLRIVFTYLFVVLWGMGPATAGITYVLRNFAREEHAWIWSDFKDALKSNFKQSSLVFIIDLAAFVVLYIAYTFYSQLSGVLSAMSYVIVMLAMIYTMMHFYIYPMMVTFKLSLKDLYRNALLFAVGKLPSNLLVLVLLLFVHLGLVFGAIWFGGSYYMLILIIILLLELVILLSFSAFLVNFNTYPKMKKYMLNELEAEPKNKKDIIEEDIEVEAEELQGFDYRKYRDNE